MDVSGLTPGTELVLTNTDGQNLAVRYRHHNHVGMLVEDARGYVHDVAWTDPHLWVADPATHRAYTYRDEQLVGPPPELE